jgi:hypothetical protein
MLDRGVQRTGSKGYRSWCWWFPGNHLLELRYLSVQALQFRIALADFIQELLL